MGKSRARTLAPQGTAQWVTWKTTETTCGLKGKWCPVKPSQPSPSVQSSPAKSPRKHNSDRAWDKLSTNFNADYEDFGNKEPIEAPPADKSCCLCSAESTVYRCHDCLSEPLFCLKCCRDEHQRLPFHKIGKWNGGFFEEMSLTKMGMEIYLGHQGKPCPVLGEIHKWEDTDEPIHQLEEDLPTILKLPFLNGKQCITIVDKSGVHSLMIQFCHCLNACTTNKQLFEMGMFPASFTQPKTAFTFLVLDGFTLDNLECGTSAMNYYNKLRRMMSSIFPQLVPDRYRELMRLKLLKWNGFGYERRRPTSGELALFCLACPQSSINAPLPANRHPDDPSWLYARSLVMDGNFKAENLHPTHPEDECFMVSKDQYKAHLAIAKDVIQPSKCNNHRAVNQANVCVCAHHGCFVPHLVVDFQKGEHHHTNGLSQALTFYDINCQYNKHFQHRVNESLYLSLPSGMEIIPGIGLWHVHGHQDKCYVRYASTFITGATRIDGEIMEMLWAPLNIISPAVRGMSTPHRQECLDYQMNDSNFMKMICMSSFLCQKYKEAMKGVAESASAFDKLNETTDPIMIATWEEQDRYAHSYLHLDFMDDNSEDEGINGSDTESEPEAHGHRLQDLFYPEKTVIPLPSNFSIARCAELGVEHLIGQEIALREGQANNALQAIRMHLADKAVLFRTAVHPAKSQAKSMRAWTQVHSVERVIQLNTMIYMKCRAQLGNLDAHGLLKKYLWMEKCHLKTTAAVADLNAWGQRNATLP
ncbi:hypothetical protein BDR06DRAFT_984372 [Suillus hirtellus]|nr:hypothetical protein BDR06DRAFT_984372 [Suillus hirtellus]